VRLVIFKKAGIYLYKRRQPGFQKLQNAKAIPVLENLSIRKSMSALIINTPKSKKLKQKNHKSYEKKIPN
jgi:hypothetical protein